MRDIIDEIYSKQIEAIKHLETLVDAAREILNPDGADRRDWEHFEMELVRSEDFLERMKRNGRR